MLALLPGRQCRRSLLRCRYHRTLRVLHTDADRLLHPQEQRGSTTQALSQRDGLRA